MKPFFVVAGCGLLLLGVVLLVAAIVLFVISRRKRAAAVPAAAAVPPAAPPTVDPNATVVVNTNPFGTLECISGPLARQSFAVTLQGFHIGRDPALAQVVIDDPRVSKRHVWIGVRNGEVVAVDSSTNGTFLNAPANRITEARLTAGDTLLFPEDLARFVYRS